MIVGSKDDTEQTLLGEIVAQHLERRLGRPVQRKLALGTTAMVYQAVLAGQISVYPEYTGTIQTVLLREQASADAGMALERARTEAARIAQLELMEPLGLDSPPAVVVRAIDAARLHIQTLSAAAAAKNEWKLGVSFEFEERADALPALNKYHLPMAAPVRGMAPRQLFTALENRDLSMIVVPFNDGRLLSPDWTALGDDLKVFSPQQACLLARQDSLSAEPKLRPALAELSAKFTNGIMRKLNAQVDVQHRPVAEVAAGFLASAGLK